jgi:hypothetical protein
MVKKKKSKKPPLVILSTSVLMICLFFFPGGFVELFYLVQHNLFGGDQILTTWFFYAWTSIGIILAGGYLFLRHKRNRNAVIKYIPKNKKKKKRK